MSNTEKNRILIVEDDDENAERYTDWLRADGHIVERAADADEARRMVTQVQPDVIVLDLRIPSGKGTMDDSVDHGLAVLTEFVKQEPFRPIVVATAHSKDRELTRRVFQITRGGGFVFKDEHNLRNVLIKAVAMALESPAFVASKRVKAFEAVIENPQNDTKSWENEIRKQLSKNWRAIVGPQYVSCHSPYPIFTDMNADLLFGRPDGYPDIWELKLPTDRIFEYYNERRRLSKECATGVGQLMEYIDRAEKVQKDPQGYEARRGVNVSMHRPRGVVVIGRDGDETERDRLALENSFYAGIRIMTYDDLLRGARNILQYLREHRNGFDDK